MKRIIVILLLLIPICSLGQNRTFSGAFINSIPISFDDVFIKLNSIKEFKVIRDSTSDKIVITTYRQPWQYITFKDLLKRSKPIVRNTFIEFSNPVFYIDGKRITDTSKIMIDNAYKHPKKTSRKVTKINGVSRFQENTDVIEIWLTKKTFREFKALGDRPQIYLRGKSSNDINNYLNK